ncbi:MAG: serine hydrolase domain-containing protein [Acidimicrobiales bacterium]
MESSAELQTLVEKSGFSGAITVERDGESMWSAAAGYANRSEGLPNTLETRFATASATKGFTALTVASLVESGRLSLATPLVELTGADLVGVDDGVTIEHLLGHTSGVGDYLDEEQLGDIDDHVLGVPAHQLEGPADYLPLLNAHPQVSPPGSRFAYNNSGYVMLALAAERAARMPYHQLVRERVFDAAAMTSSDFFRSDNLPRGAAKGYLENGRTNVFHLPVIGTGDGGAYTTVADMSRLWSALLGGEIIDRALVDMMTAPRQTVPSGRQQYGLGFWIGPDHRTIMLEGMDAGVSFRSAHQPATGRGYTIVSNTSSGVWPIAKFLDSELLDERP